MANEVEKKEDAVMALTSAAAKASEYYLKEVTALNGMSGIEMTEGGKRCGMNFVSALVAEFGVDGLRELDRNDINNALQFVCAYELDVNANQVYIDKRKKGGYDPASKKWVSHTSIKAMPEGTAFELMVAKFGVGVKPNGVLRPWVVHEGDVFVDAQFSGTTMVPPQFKPSYKNLSNPAVLVVYPILKADGSIDYPMADRASVAHNLAAHILNNKLGDKPNPKEFDGGWKSAEFKKAQEDYNKAQAEMRKYLEGKTYEDMMADPSLDQYISPAWKSPSARETMVVTKMKKNALSGYTRDLGSRTRILTENDDDVDPAFKKDVVDEQTGEKQDKPEDAKQKIVPPQIRVEGPAPQNPEGQNPGPAAAPAPVKPEVVSHDGNGAPQQVPPSPKPAEKPSPEPSGDEADANGEIRQGEGEGAQEGPEGGESDEAPHFGTEGL